VILTGGVTEARDAENLLREGAADLIGVGRALLKDPAWSLRALGEQKTS
ncbi:MAG: NADH:flavin oxidoreductase, partial [Oscillospiraceae bacterium]|nr:NADH:flavin oxidoreductase [Oscillospiraceae bacterium]